MKKSNKSKKTLTIFATIFVLGVITLAFLTGCVNPFFPKLKDKPDGTRTGEDFAVTIAAAFEPDGKHVTLTATVTGNNGGILSYQWYKNTTDNIEDGTELYGETQASYMPPVHDVGTTFYYVEATNVLKGKTSVAVSNTIGIIIHGDGDVEIIGSEIETPVVTAAYTLDGATIRLTAAASVSDGGTLSYQWYANTEDLSAGGTELFGETGTTCTPPVDTDGTTYYYVKATNTLRGQTASAVSNTVKIVVQNNEIVIEEIIVSDTVETPVVSVTAENNGANVTLTAAASVSDGGELSYQWYKNTIDSGRGGTPVAGATETSYTPPNINGTAYYYVKATNTLKGQTASAISNTVKIVVQNSEIIEVIVSDTVVTPVVTITASVNGRNVTLTAEASAGEKAALSYQWYHNTANNSKNGALIPDATGINYAPPTASPGTTTYYYVKVTNNLNGHTAVAVSNILGVVVPAGGGHIEIIYGVETPKVTISADVNDRDVTLTADASVGDGGTISYQWYSNTHNNRNGAPIQGETEDTYTPPTSSVGTIFYYVRATNTLDGKTAGAFSNIIGVAVPAGGGDIEIIEVETPTVTITAAVAGLTVTLTADASVSDGGTISYQWYRNTTNSKTGGTLITGATGDTYQPPTASPGTTYYYVEAANTLNGHTASAFSNVLGVVVPTGGGTGGGTIEILHVETPTVTISAAVNGSTVTLTAFASVSEGILSYQWYSSGHNNTNGTIIQNATGITYQPPTTSPGTTYYYVEATNTLDGKTARALSNILGVVVPAGGGTGGGTVMVVEAEMPAISVTASPSGPHHILATVTLTATAGSVSDGGTLSYQWYSNTTNSSENGTIVPNATGLTYQPPTSSIGTKYYYCVATNTLNEKSAGAKSNVVEVEVKVTEIHSATVTMTAPAKSESPNAQAHTSETDFTIGSVAWSSNGAPHTGEFLGGTAYTATVTLTAQVGYAFASSFTATINGSAATVTNNTNGSVTISLDFDKTLDKVISKVEITAQPTKTTYTHGETLDLTGLTIKVTYENDDNQFDTGTLAALSAHDKLGTNIWAEPANGEQLSKALHNGEPVVITAAGGETASTGNLTVNQKGLTITAASHTKPYDGTTTATGITVTEFTGKEFFDDVDITSATGEYTSANAGTKTLNITSGTLTGNHSDNYFVAAVNGLTVAGGITKIDPTVTSWPTAAAITYGAALSTSALNGGVGAGSFAWTNGAAIPTVTNSGYEVTFTPTDAANYNTLTQNVNITVNKANPTVTWPTAAAITYGAALSTSALSGGVGEGSFAWTNGTTIPTVNNSGYSVTFTPTDTNYNTLTQNVNITVNKADPTVTWPTGFTAGYGTTLSQITISGGSASVDGTFTWTTPTALVGALGTQSHSMTFTPTDTNYNTLTQNVSITVNKADPTVRWPSGLTATYGQTLTDISLPGNGTGAGTFTWTTSSTPVGDASGSLRSHSMTFTPTDTANYNTLTQNVNITVNPKTLTLTVVTPPDPNLTLTPIGGTPYSNTTTFVITVDGLLSNDTATVTSSLGCLRLSNNTVLTNNVPSTVTMTYTGADELYSGNEEYIGSPTRTTSLRVTGNYTLDSTPTFSVNVIDGVTADRVIPVTQENIDKFNTYANSYGFRRRFKLMEDVTAPTTWTPIGTIGYYSFTGSFDGQGHTITGLTAPMFGYVGTNPESEIKNLGLKNANINNQNVSVTSGSYYTGALVAYLADGTVQDCFVTGSVTSTLNITIYIGGVVGRIAGGTVQDCYSTANVSGGTTTQINRNSYIGGVVGYMTGGTVQNCYATGSVNGSNTPTLSLTSVGGVVGYVAIGSGTTITTITNCVALNSLINATDETISTGIIGRVYGNGTPTTSTYNYGKTGMTMTSNSTTVTPTSDASGKDGADTSTWNTSGFWTTASNWGGTAWDFTNVWEWNASLSRPILKGFAAGAQGE
jgi:ribosomal protein L11